MTKSKNLHWYNWYQHWFSPWRGWGWWRLGSFAYIDTAIEAAKATAGTIQIPDTRAPTGATLPSAFS